MKPRNVCGCCGAVLVKDYVKSGGTKDIRYCPNIDCSRKHIDVDLYKE